MKFYTDIHFDDPVDKHALDLAFVGKTRLANRREKRSLFFKKKFFESN